MFNLISFPGLKDKSIFNFVTLNVFSFVLYSTPSRTFISSYFACFPEIFFKETPTTISSSRFNNLKWEPTATSSAAARLGKAPVEKVIQILKDNKINFSNSNINYPRSAADFKKKQAEFVKMFNMVKTKKVETVIKSDKDFVNNITKVFSVSPQLANTKLMQLTFFALI